MLWGENEGTPLKDETQEPNSKLIIFWQFPVSFRPSSLEINIFSWRTLCPVSQEIWLPRKFGHPGPNFLGNLAPGGAKFPTKFGPHFGNLAPLYKHAWFLNLEHYAMFYECFIALEVAPTNLSFVTISKYCIFFVHPHNSSFSQAKSVGSAVDKIQHTVFRYKLDTVGSIGVRTSCRNFTPYASFLFFSCSSLIFSSSHVIYNNVITRCSPCCALLNCLQHLQVLLAAAFIYWSW